MLLDQVKTLLRLLQNNYDAKEGFIDLSSLSWLYPLELLPLAALISDKSLDFIRPDEKALKYLEYFNFPEGLNKYQKQSTRYLPIYKFSAKTRDISASGVRSEIINNLIEIFVNRVGVYSGVKDALYLSVDEIIANIDEHSISGTGWIHAQYYPTKKFLDICLVDTGVSIPGSFRNHSITFTNDTSAIIKALNGVSVSKEKLRGAGMRTFVKMATSGLGGEAVIISGKGLIYANRKSTIPYNIRTVEWKGTIIGLRIPSREGSLDYTKYIAS